MPPAAHPSGRAPSRLSHTAQTRQEKGPTWANSLFEDNADNGYGMRLAVNSHRKLLKCTWRFAGNEHQSGIKDAVKYALAHWNEVDQAAKDNAEKIKQLLPSVLEDCCDCSLSAPEQIEGTTGLIWWINQSGVLAVTDGHTISVTADWTMLWLPTAISISLSWIRNSIPIPGGQASKATPLGSVVRFGRGRQSHYQERPGHDDDELRLYLCRQYSHGRE